MKAIAAKQSLNDIVRMNKGKVRIPAPSAARASVFSSQDISIQRKPTCPCGGGCPRCFPKPSGGRIRGTASSETLEREADRLATAVVGRIGRLPTTASHLSTPVSPLPAITRVAIESVTGHDLGAVRVHTGSGADAVAAEHDARALTVGNDVVFAAGEYASQTASGLHLLAHELVHVAQQSRAPGPQVVMAQRKRGGEQRAFPWTGRIAHTWSAALRSRPGKDPQRPYEGTIADLPRGTQVEVLDSVHGWLRLSVTIGERTLTGYVSHELVELVGPGPASGAVGAIPAPAEPKRLVPLGYGSTKLVPEHEARAYQERVQREIMQEAVLQRQRAKLKLQEELRENPERHLTKSEYLLIWSEWHPHTATGHDVPPDACVLVDKSGVCQAITSEYAAELVARGEARRESFRQYEPMPTHLPSAGTITFTPRMNSISEVIKKGREIDKVDDLVKHYGGRAKGWRKMKTWDEAGREIHYYEHHGIGKKLVKFAGQPDPPF